MDKSNLSSSSLFKTDEFAKVVRESMSKENDGAMYCNLGVDYYEENQLDKAIIAFEKSIEIDPNIEMSYYFLGLIYYKLSFFDEAISNFDILISKNPTNMDLHYIKGRAYFLKGEILNGIFSLTLVLKIDHINTDADKLCVEAFNEIIRLNKVKFLLDEDELFQLDDQINKEIKLYTLQIDKDLLNKEAYLRRGFAYIEKGNYEKALKDIEYSVIIDSNYSTGYYILYLFHSAMNNQEKWLNYLVNFFATEV